MKSKIQYFWRKFLKRSNPAISWQSYHFIASKQGVKLFHNHQELTWRLGFHCAWKSEEGWSDTSSWAFDVKAWTHKRMNFLWSKEAMEIEVSLEHLSKGIFRWDLSHRGSDFKKFRFLGLIDSKFKSYYRSSIENKLPQNRGWWFLPQADMDSSWIILRNRDESHHFTGLGIRSWTGRSFLESGGKELPCRVLGIEFDDSEKKRKGILRLFSDEDYLAWTERQRKRNLLKMSHSTIRKIPGFHSFSSGI